MSTGHQQYSPEDQVDVIRQYATDHNMEIVQVYSDHGRSGLNIAGRDGLNQLVADVEGKAARLFRIFMSYLLRMGKRKNKSPWL